MQFGVALYSEIVQSGVSFPKVQEFAQLFPRLQEFAQIRRGVHPGYSLTRDCTIRGV